MALSLVFFLAHNSRARRSSSVSAAAKALLCPAGASGPKRGALGAAATSCLMVAAAWGPRGATNPSPVLLQLLRGQVQVNLSLLLQVLQVLLQQLKLACASCE